MRILMIVLPDSELPSPHNSPGRRIIEPYYIFRDLGIEVDVATLTGGPVWSRRDQAAMDKAGATMQRFLIDRIARDLFADGLQIDQIAADDFQAAFCTAIPMQETTEPAVAKTVLDAFYAGGRPVALVPAQMELVNMSDGAGFCLLGSNLAHPATAAKTLLTMLADVSRTHA